MNRLRTRVRGPRTRLAVELLEDRAVPAALSISDATAVEGSTAIRFIDRFVAEGSGGINVPAGPLFGPDANQDGAPDLYVVGTISDAVHRYDGRTGALIDTFVPAGSGGLDAPMDLAFGPDGNLYVSSSGSNQVLRYSGSSGAFLSVVASGLSSPHGLMFGGDGSLYIANQFAHEVLCFRDGTLSAFVTAGSGGLLRPRESEFGPDGNGDEVPDLYVASRGANGVYRYDGLTGAFIDKFAASPAGLPGSFPTGGFNWLQFGTDGYLYTTARTLSADDHNTSFVRFNAATGAFVDTFPLGRDGWSFVIGPDGLIYDSTDGDGNFVDRLGHASIAVFTVTLDAPSASPVSVSFATADGTALAGSDYTATSDTLVFAPGQTTRTILVQTLNDAVAEGSETFTLSLSNPAGATITDGTGVAKITDYATKFFAVNDGSPDQTYRYGAPGNSLGSPNLGSGNTAPRGIASTGAGDRVWVVDANKKLYVYDAAGALLGSWTAGSLASNAQVEGITVSGSDVWLVDARQDRVFRYAGAATRLSGSQNASSSFALNTGNKDAKDLVTDCASIWVVNDSTTDRVFKYSLAGRLLGSWTITGGGGSPTGITLDPSSSQQHLWVVDSATDRVYQYDNARSRTSGSQSAGATFALAAGNTNPQGIADPPVVRIDDATAVEGSTAIRFIDRFVSEGSGGLDHPNGLLFGPDGNQDGAPDLYVAGGASDTIHRYDGRTGALMDTFVTPGSGGLDAPLDLVFGPDGNLYVSSEITNQVVQYHGSSGAFLGVVASGLSSPHGLMFGSDGSLYIANQFAHEVLRYQNGSLSAFVSAGSGGLLRPREAEFGPDGNGDGVQDLYVASRGANKVFRYNGLTGAFLDAFAASPSGLPGSFPTGGYNWLQFGTDGDLYTTARTASADEFNTSFVRFNAVSGAFVDTFPLGRDGWSFILGPDNLIYDSNYVGDSVERLGHASLAAFTVGLDAPSVTPVTVQFAIASGTATASSDFASGSGTLTFAPGQTTRTILVRTLDDTLYEGNETFTVNLSNPVGATTADAQAVGTIADNELPRLQVASAAVNGSAAQRSRVTELTLTFNALAALPANPANAFRLTRTGPGGSTSDVTLAVDLSASTATRTIARLTFSGSLTESGSLADGLYRLTVLATQVSGSGQPLDGDGNGTPGGDFVLDLHRLYGDVNGDKAVNGLDFAAFRAAFGASPVDPSLLAAFDSNGDGAVNGLDFAAFRGRFGQPPLP